MAAVFTLAPEAGEGLFTVHGLNTAALDGIVAAIQHLARLRQFYQVSGHCVFDELIRRSAGLFGKLVKAGFGFGREAHFHTLSLKA